MNKIKFANGTEVPCTQVMEGPEFYDNAHRRVLSVEMEKTQGQLDTLDALLSGEGNLDKIVHVNTDNGAEDVFDHYEIKMELGVKPLPAGEDEDGAPIMEERIVFKLGRLTPIEQKLKKLGL